MASEKCRSCAGKLLPNSSLSIVDEVVWDGRLLLAFNLFAKKIHEEHGLGLAPKTFHTVHARRGNALTVSQH